MADPFDRQAAEMRYMLTGKWETGTIRREETLKARLKKKAKAALKATPKEIKRGLTDRNMKKK